MRPKPLPSVEELHALFRYDRRTGRLVWRHRPGARGDWNARLAGRAAGSKCNGRRRVALNGGSMLASRVIWKMFHGTEPDVVDHVDGDPGNDRISNLRAATRAENARNSRRRGRSGFKGVHYAPRRRRWVARIHLDGRPKHLGCFHCPQDAHAAYARAARKHFGAFARTE